MASNGIWQCKGLRLRLDGVKADIVVYNLAFLDTFWSPRPRSTRSEITSPGHRCHSFHVHGYGGHVIYLSETRFSRCWIWRCLGGVFRICLHFLAFCPSRIIPIDHGTSPICFERMLFCYLCATGAQKIMFDQRFVFRLRSWCTGEVLGRAPLWGFAARDPRLKTLRDRSWNLSFLSRRKGFGWR